MDFLFVTDTSLLTWHNLFHTVEGIVALATMALALVTASLAGATLVMATKTASLANSTRDEVAAVGRQIELDEHALAALQEQVEVQRLSSQSTIRPVLVDLHRPLDPAEVGDGMAVRQHEVAWSGAPERKRLPAPDSLVWASDAAVYFTVPLRNVGPGTAFIRAAGLKWLRPVAATGSPSTAIVPPGEVTRVQLTLDRAAEGAPSLDDIEQYGSFTVEVAYTDVAGEQWTLTRAHVQRDRQYPRWYTSQVFIHHLRGGDANVGFDWGADDEFVAASGAAWGL